MLSTPSKKVCIWQVRKITIGDETNSKTLLVAPGVGECVIATRQCQELKVQSKVGIITKSNLTILQKQVTLTFCLNKKSSPRCK